MKPVPAKHLVLAFPCPSSPPTCALSFIFYIDTKKYHWFDPTGTLWGGTPLLSIVPPIILKVTFHMI